MNISVVGCGRWGTFIAWYLCGIFGEVTLLGRESSEKFLSLKSTRRNEYVTLPEGVRLSSDFAGAIAASDITVVSIGSQSLRSFLISLPKELVAAKTFVFAMKGIESDTGMRLTEVAESVGASGDDLAVWLGPGHIQEFVAGKPNCMVIDSKNKTLVRRVADLFKSKVIRFYYGDDLIGNEIGAAAKNVFGICAGLLDGADLKTLKGALMARGAREVSRLIKAMGGNELSAYGLCHLGDYETTLFSPYSNNRAYGEALYKGERFSKLAEGVYTAKALKFLGEKYGVDLPITSAVYSVLYENKSPLLALEKLFSRTACEEFYS